MRYSDLLERAQDYNQDLEDFIGSNDLPETWFTEGVDHFALKAYSPDDYERTVREINNFSSATAESYIQGRRIAAAQLMGEFALKQDLMFGSSEMVRWVEIIEARPEHQSAEPVRLDHAEVYVPQGIIPMRRVLQRKGLYPVDEENRSHEWLSVMMKPYDKELKFSDKPLSQIVKADLSAGRSTLL